PDVVDIEEGSSLLARASSEEIEEVLDTRQLVTVPLEFLQDSPESEPVRMRVPRPTEYTSLRSVLRILHLMNVAVDKCNALKGPRDTFRNELNKTPYLVSCHLMMFKINQNRFPEPTDEHLQELDLETLKYRITNAVKSQTLFQGEVTISADFFPGAKKMGMKVPYPGNEEAVQSVDAILYLLHSGIPQGREAEKLLDHWKGLRYRLNNRFNLKLKQYAQKVMALTQGEREAFERQFIRVVGLHNNNEWIFKDIQEKITIPQIFVPVNWKPRHVTLRIPSNNDKSGVASVNNILQLMAKVAGADTIGRNIEIFHERLTTVFKLENIKFPVDWGTSAMKNEERAHQQSLVATEIKKHNEAVEKWNEESVKHVFKGIGHRKRKADGSLEKDGTLQKQKGGDNGNKSAGEGPIHDNQVGTKTGTTGSHLEPLMPPMAPGTNNQSHRITLPGIQTAFGEQLDGTVHPEQLEGTNHRPTFPGVLRVPPNNQRGDPKTSSQRGPS
ncbi:hypothetical protein H0H93_002713, partial [Arthromyces matolae]